MTGSLASLLSFIRPGVFVCCDVVGGIELVSRNNQGAFFIHFLGNPPVCSVFSSRPFYGERELLSAIGDDRMYRKQWQLEEYFERIQREGVK